MRVPTNDERRMEIRLTFHVFGHYELSGRHVLYNREMLHPMMVLAGGNSN